MKQIWMWPIALGVSVMLAGCPPRTAESQDGGDRVAGSEERMSEVQVTLDEFTIGMDPESAPAGTVVFKVSNVGETVHAFEIEGQGIEESTEVLDPGESATLRVENLDAGTYTVYCPVGNHQERGMEDTFTVTENSEGQGQ